MEDITLDQLQEDLIGPSTIKRRKAAKKIRGMSHYDGSCQLLLKGLEIELGGKHWQTQVELLETIGEINCRCSISAVGSLAFDTNEEYSLLKMRAAKCWVRLSRESLSDGEAVRELMIKGTYSAKEGALEALAYDRMKPKADILRELIELCWDFGSDRLKGYTDPRYGLAACCAWSDLSLTKDFLEHCVKSGDVPLKYVALASLKNEIVKLR